MLDAANEARAQPLNRPRQGEVRQPREERLDHDAQFLPRQPRPEAEMLPQPERQVLVRAAADIKAVRVGKDRRIAVRRRVPQEHPLALRGSVARAGRCRV